MKTAIKLVTIVLLSAALAGCATSGKVYEDSKLAMIKKDATTEVELLDWFGPATSRSMGFDGTKTLTWRFAQTKVGISGSAGRLEVRLGADGKVAAYTATAGAK